MVNFTQYIPIVKMVLYIFVLGIFLVVGWWYFFIHKRRRRWRVELHEQKADGKLHTVGRDMLVEKRKKYGTVCYYWMKKAKQEAIPPPSHVVDRYSGKEEVDYLRIERDLVPAEKKARFNYNDPEINAKVVNAYDRLLEKLHGIKVTFFNSEPVKERFIYIPIERALTAKVVFSPIPFDMNMMAVNEISNADQHFSGQYEWWKKYGAVLVFALTVVFLLIITVLTYDHLQKTTEVIVGKLSETNGVLQSLSEKIVGAAGKPVQ